MNLALTFTFPEDSWHCWHLAGAAVFVRRKGNYWQGYCRKLPWNERCGVCSGPVPEEPEPGLPLINVAGETETTVVLKPCLPEKPFLLNMNGLRLLPGAEISLGLQLPPVYRLMPEEKHIPSEQPEYLFTFAPFELKGSWYGENTTSGILCSSLPFVYPAPDNNSASTNPAASCKTESLSVIDCTLVIRNKNKTALELDKIPLYTDSLGIYEINGRTVSDKPVIDVYANDFRISVMEECGTLLAPAVKSGKGDTLIRKSTQIIKNITRYR